MHQYTCTCIHTHIHIHTRTHTHTHAHTYTHTHTQDIVVSGAEDGTINIWTLPIGKQKVNVG